MAEHVMLVGMMGSGKTTVGRMLAARLGRVFHDSDAEIVAKTGCTVAEIFASRGEAAFRAEEKTVLARALSGGVPSVVAVAGGAIFDPESRRRVAAAGPVIWLRAEPRILASRVAPAGSVHDHRPLLANDPAGTLQRLDARRRPLYRRISDAVIDVDWVSPRVVAERAEHCARELLVMQCR